MSPFPDPVEAVSQRLIAFFAEQRESTRADGPEAVSFVDAAAAAVTGGKRLRARFCITGWRAVAEAGGRRPGAVPTEVIDAAAALEIFQAAALVHDDLIDNSDTRRGRPAAHRALEAGHRDAGWLGDEAEFGRSAAILLGDLLVAWSDDLFETGLRSATHAPTARQEYARMRRDVTVGQFLDIAEEAAFRQSPDSEHAERALRVASLKSARYSVQQPLLVGAALAGADASQHAALAAFGHPVGLAFQLRDDVLGVFGDAAVTGKPSGDDLREGKRTVLIAYAREALPAGARHTLDELVGDPLLDADQVAALQRTISESGALARVEALIADYTAEADRALRGARLGDAAVGELRDLTRAATARTS
ncbi:polyprenyl synthetase family protein [Microbacterium sp. zg.Y1090]|uniref:polyprenyl synthetase family protein n=1 Tax=Microbacterium TaxID=33882 RepID=UPI00214D0A79|nr:MULTISPECIES: polyprenyl synthetase family protein [unclassified Microbacterium]MCR2811426.1 polyprenyl synthetase family protein [Microbacterium sp. zg.Y1084]MCR2819156.1 polyprenyl synthetase family protein [Microbacterium sp. zg.Y1090]MDL5487845.1 polyprenyl synthetase family protein [Microbacterium sp. zg-Y1211]WIM27456.1 polyprenyl synthetase family protein [Microbacterium sp. zg-Y1090]